MCGEGKGKGKEREGNLVQQARGKGTKRVGS
jgi:hypothetical protein